MNADPDDPYDTGSCIGSSDQQKDHEQEGLSVKHKHPVSKLEQF